MRRFGKRLLRGRKFVKLKERELDAVFESLTGSRMTASEIYYGDLKVGEALAAGDFEVTLEEIQRFSNRYDPRPYHLDEDAAADSIFGGLVASGAQTLAFWNYLRFKAEDGLEQLATLSLDNVHFHAPVRPGDRLRLEAVLHSARRSTRKPDRGLMTFRHSLYNQDGVLVIDVDVCLLVARRSYNDGSAN